MPQHPHPSLSPALSAALALNYLFVPAFWPPCPADSSSVFPKQTSRPFSKLKSDLPLKHLKIHNLTGLPPTYATPQPISLSSSYHPTRPASLPPCTVYTCTALMSYPHGIVDEPIRTWRWLSGGICTLLIQHHPMLPHPPSNNIHTIPTLAWQLLTQLISTMSLRTSLSGQ